jgi:hypothetical protein
MRRQDGASGIFVFALLILMLVVMAALFTLSRTRTAVDASSQTTTGLATAAAALEQFAGSSGRLPCPADPATDNGLASPNTASVDCNFPQGTLPWATVGMRRDDAYDAWGWKISYRVYSGAGGMTQDQGASMVNCDTSPTLGSAGVDANKLCRSTHTTLPSEFLAGKGLDVTDFGTPYSHTANNGAAFVLVSHGATGLGAYTSAGVQKTAPNSNDEKNNLNATGPFVAESASSPDVAPDANNHFDDSLLHRTVSDLVRRANLSARDWPDNFASTTLDSPTIQAALGLTTAPSYGDLNVGSMFVTDALISSTTSANLSFDTSGGNEGVGIAGGGGTGITPGEGVRIKFDKAADKLAISLNDMGIVTFGFVSWTERAQIQFFKNGSAVGTPVTLQGCRADGQFASFTLTPGVNFDQIELTALATTQDSIFHTTINSNFFVSGFKTCDAAAATCITSIEAANPTSHCS